MRAGAERYSRASACVLLIMAGFVFLGQRGIAAQEQQDEFTMEFFVEDCRFSSTGVNPYLILLPGYQLVLEAEEDGEVTRLEITVLCETETICLKGVGRIVTRVVEERETVNGELAEVSRNFFAICRKTNDVFYFGEEVDIYEDGEIVSHEGAWRAGENGAKPGIIMPGRFLLGSRYFQEIAPDVALDRAEHTAMGLTIETPMKEFENCAEVTETSPLEPGSESIKAYARGVGLIVDDDLELVDFGFVRRRPKCKNSED